MAANIHINNGVAAMVSYRQSPWHEQGRVVDFEMTDEQILSLAGLDWHVEPQSIYVKGEEEGYNLVDGHKLLVRSDTNEGYGVVGALYRPFQNVEMVQLLRSIAKTTPVVWETAGALGTGQTVWVLGRLPDLKISLGKDVTDVFMLVSNGHGNRRALQIMPTGIRVVCQNTMRLALGGFSRTKQRMQALDDEDFSNEAMINGYAIVHSRGMDTAVSSVVAAYQSIVNNIKDTTDVLEALADTPCSKSKAIEYWEAVFKTPSSATETPRAEALREQREKLRSDRLGAIWESPTSKVDGTTETLFAAYQTVVEYTDFSTASHSDVTRFRKAQFGSGAVLKANALNIAVTQFI